MITALNLLKNPFDTLRKGLVVLTLLMATLSINSSAQIGNETMSTGSFIINMGVTPQTVANSLRPYGLVYQLIRTHRVPVRWVINPAKAKDGADFTYLGNPYRGGTFIVPAEYRTTAVNTTITTWQGLGVVGVTTVSPVTVPVFDILYTFPRWVLDAQNGDIAEEYLINAGIPTTPSGFAYIFKSPSQLDGCDDLYIMPHADPTWGTHSNLRAWNLVSKGSIWAACHAVSVLENTNNGTLQMNFLMNNVGAAGNAAVPFGSHADGSYSTTLLIFKSGASHYAVHGKFRCCNPKWI